MKLIGRIKNGQVQVQRFFKQDLAKWEGKSILIERADGKTQSQLGYLFGVVFKIVSGYTGFTVEETYQVYKKKFLSYEKEHKGKIYKFEKGLSQCKIDEAKEFIDKVIKHATAELNLIVPESDEEFEYGE